jgi:competence protein ComEC
MKRSNKNLPWTILGILLILDIFLWSQIIFYKIDDPLYYFLDVGQGDSQLILASDDLGRPIKLLIDGGPDSKVMTQLGKILEPSDRYIDLVLMTHPQLDHFGGLIDVLRNYKIGAFLGTGRASTISAYKQLMDIIKEKDIPYIVLKESDKIKYGGVIVDILSPNKKYLKSVELNDTCLVTLITMGGHRALYVCDAGFNIEDELRIKYNLEADILKVGHHGSRFSSGDRFLQAVNPKVAIIEVGKNSYGHPTPRALANLSEVAAKIFRTDLSGNLMIRFENNLLKVYQEK